MRVHARKLWFWTTLVIFTLLLADESIARSMDPATELKNNNSRDSNGYYAQALQSHPPQDAPPRAHQANPGGTAAGNVKPENQHQKSMGAERTCQMAGKEVVGPPPQKYLSVAVEGSTAGVIADMFDTPMTEQRREYASAYDNTMENAAMQGGATSTSVAWMGAPMPIAMMTGSSLAGGGGALDVIEDDSLFPKGDCCSTNGMFDLLNPPQCCKVNGVFLPFGPKPACCLPPKKNNNGGAGGGGVSSFPVPVQTIGALHTTMNGSGNAAIQAMAAMAGNAMESAANGKTNAAKADSQAKQSSRASAAGEDCIRDLFFAVEDYTQYLINVANEDAGSPCSARQPFKTYANVVYMVQKMYHHTYLPLAILFLLPGAIITQVKGLVGFGIIGARDEDTVSPFTGIFRAIIAIFLIPVTQLAVSYMIDIGNCCEESVNKYVSMPLIFLWIEEQIVIFDPQQQGNLIKNMPNIPMSPLRGKFSGMPVKGAMMEQISGLDAALAEICNEAVHMLSIAMTVMSAFQIATVCYLFLVGPLAAAFFAWPGVGKELFRRSFSSWLDAVVIVSLWKFWWCVVLAAWTIWLESGVNPFDPIGPHWLICWMAILISVPFNPFEFKPSEIIQHVMAKAEAVAAKVAQSGKGGGSGGGGKAKGKGSPAAG